MARPSKNGVDYFSHDTTSGKTIFTLESKFGNDGYAFWFKLLETLGSQDTLSLDCNNLPDWEYLIAKTRVNEITATEILDTLARINAIDTDLWERKVIWVQKFAERLSPVFKKRKTETPTKPNFCDRNPRRNDVPVEKSTQRKGKESKEKKNKETAPPYPLDEFCFGVELEKQILIWLEYKNEKNQPYKPTGFKTLLGQIKKQSDECGDQAVIDLINVCMASNWQGIIWDKLQKPDNPKSNTKTVELPEGWR